MAFVRWIQPPTNIAGQIAARSGRVQQKLTASAFKHAERGEEQMKARAPWNDQSGDAREGLFGTADPSGDVIEIILGGTVPYQPFLELGTYKMEPRPIILEVEQEVAAAFTKESGDIVRSEFG